MQVDHHPWQVRYFDDADPEPDCEIEDWHGGSYSGRPAYVAMPLPPPALGDYCHTHR